MLGKTNVLALQEGSIITEIKDFSWLKMIVEVYGNFVKAIYNDNYLAAITADGSVVYSMDGEVWNISTPEFENCKLNDIEWDGTKFILVGSQTKTIESFTGEYGLVITTVDFVTYEEIKINNESNVLTGTSSNLYYDIEYVAVLFNNGKYTIAAVRYNGSYIKIHFYIGNLTDFQMSKEHISIDSGQRGIQIAKKENKFIIYTWYQAGAYKYHQMNITTGEKIILSKNISSSTTGYAYDIVNVFKCKDIVYYMNLLGSENSSFNYKLVKILDSNEEITESYGKNFMFKSGVYFNECEVFINAHEMLIVKKGETISDKTIEDLIEIVPENTMNIIIKAFNQLYIFGNRGLILKSSMETNNNEAITVQTLSAKKALAQAKAYTDEKITLTDTVVTGISGRFSLENGKLYIREV